MAGEKTINTRIQLKYDALENWMTQNPTLKAGEVAIVAIPTGEGETVEQVTKPAIVFKVGDGTSDFNALPYASGLAADVYEWAKASEKPSYNLDEITGWSDEVLDDEIKSLITSALTELLESEDFEQQVISDVTETVTNAMQEAETYIDTSIAGLAGEDGVNVTSGNYIIGINIKESTEEEIEAGASKYVLELTENALPETDLTDYYTKSEVDEELAKKQDSLTFDTTPTKDSENPVTSGGVYSAISDAIDGVTQFDFEVVDELPNKGVKGIIYLLEHTHGENDVYDEYIWDGEKFEKIGNTDIDLTNYVTNSSLEETLAGYVTTSAMDEKVEEVKDAIESEINTLSESVKTVSSSLDELSSSVNDLSSTVTSQGESISSLQTTVGNADSGLVKDVADIQTSLENVYTKEDADSAISTAIKGLGEAGVTENNKYVTGVKVTEDGKLTVEEEDLPEATSYEVTADSSTGLKVTTNDESGDNKTTFTIGFEEDVVFVFNCGNATLED